MLANAFQKMLQDPKYLADATRIFGAPIQTFVGADAEVILDRAMTVPPEIQSFLKKLLKG